MFFIEIVAYTLLCGQLVLLRLLRQSIAKKGKEEAITPIWYNP